MTELVALITGGNKGLGFETARRLGSDGYRVIIGARDSARGEEAERKLRDQKIDARAVQLDVTDRNQVIAAAAWVQREYGRLDVLINNAGIALDRDPVSTVNLDNYKKTLETNVISVIAVTQAFLPLLRKSPAGRIVNVSSGLGSLEHNADPFSEYAAVKPAAYNSSKAALNMITILLADELKQTPIKVNSADPGYTATDLNNNQGHQTVTEGTDAIVRLATLNDDGPTGRFFNRMGSVPW